jgi:hypothetical protein
VGGGRGGGAGGGVRGAKVTHMFDVQYLHSNSPLHHGAAERDVGEGRGVNDIANALLGGGEYVCARSSWSPHCLPSALVEWVCRKVRGGR